MRDNISEDREGTIVEHNRYFTVFNTNLLLIEKGELDIGQSKSFNLDSHFVAINTAQRLRSRQRFQDSHLHHTFYDVDWNHDSQLTQCITLVRFHTCVNGHT